MSKKEIPLLLEKGPLRVRYLRGKGRTLVASFAGVGRQRSVEPPIEFPTIASEDNRNHVLFFTDRSRSWLNAEGMATHILHTIQATAERVGADRVIALGNSMGGTMALQMSRLFEFERVIALTPQYSVIPGEVPEEDRWMFFRKKIERFPFPRVAGLRPDETKYFIIHGGDRLELAHALRFPKAPGIAHFIFPDRDHRLAETLKRQNALQPLLQEIFAGQPRKFRRRIAELGGVPIAKYAETHDFPAEYQMAAE